MNEPAAKQKKISFGLEAERESRVYLQSEWPVNSTLRRPLSAGRCDQHDRPRPLTLTDTSF